MTGTTHPLTDTTMTHRLAYGAAGGVAGGLAFGVLMQMMGMIPMVAQLVGSSSIAVGWVVHLGISVVIGVTFALLLGPVASTPARAAGLGLAWGLLWWVLGALLIMPAVLGMPVLQLGTMAWQSLMGHLLFGVVLGLVYVQATRRGRS